MKKQIKYKVWFSEIVVNFGQQEFSVFDVHGFLCTVAVLKDGEPWVIKDRRAGFEPNANGWTSAENAKTSLSQMVSTGSGFQCRPLWGMLREEVNEIFNPSNGNEDGCPHISEDDWVEFVDFCEMHFAPFQSQSIFETLGDLHFEYIDTCKQ